MLSNDCSILILSCDKNIGLLNIFFDKFKENWFDCKYKIYLGLENQTSDFDNITILNSYSFKYSDRLLEYLNIIKTEYILIILDDFIIEKRVNNDVLNNYLYCICNDKSIANLTLVWIDGAVEFNYSDDLQKKCYDANFLVNLQIGFWKKDILQKLLVHGEDAWQIELYGSIRARKFKDFKFLHINNDDNMPIVYNRGWLIVKGVWNGNEILRLNLANYANYFLDGKEIKYSNFGKISKLNSLKIHLGVLIRKLLSRIGWFY